ncbi:hypothetical protein DdX_22462 [Ditylenchus destructor]|uniref:Uncharacterized protein n=1 Tax=Ditylenchus destructor TaxID=166010 RepID=A0AAD4ME27_9BILA|nr:hypothetical protein DdX_22462 [Ditylenchus destructor]
MHSGMSARLFPTASLHLFLSLAALQLMLESPRIEGIRTNAIAETLWTTLATLLWIAVSINGQCQTSKERNNVKDNAQLTSKNIRDGAAVFSTIGAGAALASGVGAPLAPIFAAVGPIVGFITGIYDDATVGI